MATLAPRIGALGALLASLSCAVDDRSVGVAGGSGGSMEPAQGSQAEVGADCDRSEATNRCVDQERTQRCEEGGRWGPVTVCAGATPICRADLGATCGCEEAQQRCVAGAAEICTEGSWQGMAACAPPLGHCLVATGTCVSCKPGSETCQGEAPLRCNAAGSWEALSGCAGELVNCGGCGPGEPCSDAAECRGGVCLTEQGSCGCEPGSCGAGQVCSPESGLCAQEPSDCPTPAPAISGDVDLVFASVRFDPSGSAEAVIQNAGAGFVSFAPGGYQLCNGAERCVFLSDDETVALSLGESFTRLIDDTTVDGGELALIFELDGTLSAEAYIAWGTGAGADSLEARVNAVLPAWQVGQRIEIAPSDSGFVCTGAADLASSYISCNP